MARVLIVGCGCRGQALTRELRVAGHAVRGTTRDLNRREEIEAAGAEAFIGDPNRVGTITEALGAVTVMCLLLGSATGTPAQLEALHTTRLEMLLQRTIDTTVRTVIYEATGTIDQRILDTGAELVQTKCTHDGVHHTVLRAEPGQWLQQALRAIEGALGQR